jgi:hypothetical protein
MLWQECVAEHNCSSLGGQEAERERERERERGIEMENGLLFVYPLQRYT